MRGERVNNNTLRARLRDAASRRCCRDEGAVLVEFALVAPLLIAILAGSFDFGVGFRNRIVLQGATRNGARAAAVLGPNTTADKAALSTIAAGTVDLTSSTIFKAIVFETDENGAVNPTCLTTPMSNSGAGVSSLTIGCNVYNNFQVTNAYTASFVQAGAGCTTGWDRFYCPANRQNALTGPPDYLGVYTEVVYTPMTKLFRTSFTLTDKVVVRVEPQPA